MSGDPIQRVWAVGVTGLSDPNGLGSTLGGAERRRSEVVRPAVEGLADDDKAVVRRADMGPMKDNWPISDVVGSIAY